MQPAVLSLSGVSVIPDPNRSAAFKPSCLLEGRKVGQEFKVMLDCVSVWALQMNRRNRVNTHHKVGAVKIGLHGAEDGGTAQQLRALTPLLSSIPRNHKVAHSHL